MSLLEKLDDALSPIVVKELRQSVQSRLVVSVLMLFLFVQLGVMAVYLVTNSIGGALDLADYQAGRDVFSILQGILLATCMLFLPAYTGSRLAAERSDTNVDLLFITTLKPRAIILGKFFAAMLLALMIFSACMPFMAFTYFLRGIDVPSIVCVIGLDFVAVVSSVLIAIFVAVIPANRPMKGVLGLLSFIALAYIFGGTLAGTMMIMQFGMAGAFDSPEVLGVAACLLVGLAGVLGLLFTWSVALVQPHSANRAWPSRLLMTLLWLAGGGCAYVCARTWREDAFIAMWVMCASVLTALGILIAINERDHWAPRTARAIPRSWVLRLPAFLFYSGAAGGILHSVLLFAVTAAIAQLWLDAGATTRSTRFLVEVFTTMSLVFLYTYAYALTAVFVRRTLLARHVGPGFTWIVALVLAAVVGLLPMLIALFVHQGLWRFNTHYPWLLTNPVAAVVAANERSFPHIDAFFTAILTWSAVVTVVNLRWFWSQLARFRPYVARPVEPPPPLLVPVETEVLSRR